MKNDADMPHELASRVLLVATAVHALVLVQFLRSDLWFDEIITLFDFVMLRDYRDIFTTYPVANNHMLFSFVEWWWLYAMDIANLALQTLGLRLGESEEVLRLPNAIFAVATGIFLYVRGRRTLGNGTALMLSILLLASPLFIGFAYQLRGYGLSMMLSAVAMIGTIEIVHGRRKDGALLFGPAVAFLPVVIPSNILVTFSLWLFLAIVLLRRRCDRRNLVFVGAAGVVSACGMTVYLLIFDKFMQVAKQTGGWESGGAVAGHFVLALLVHLGAFVLACWATRLRTPQSERVGADDPVRRLLPLLALCSALPILGLAFGRAPFPRVFLTFLPPLTLCAMWFFRADNFRRMRDFSFVVLMVLSTTIVWSQTSAYTVQRELNGGTMPQNLLQQFYARRNDVSSVADFLAHYQGVPRQSHVFVDVHNFPTLRYYWVRLRQDRSRLECLNGGTMVPLRMPVQAYRHVPQVIVTYNPEKAAKEYSELTGLTPVLEQIYTRTTLGIYRIVAISDPKHPMRRPRFSQDDPI